MDWEKRFSDIGAFWHHDGNPKRPYARLTSGLISNGFFNGEIVAKHAKLFGEACECLATIGGDSFAIRSGSIEYYVVGPAMGAIKISGRIAEAFDCLTAYAEKEDDGSFAFKRASFGPRVVARMSEDTVTTGDSLLKMRKAIELAAPGCTFAPEILALCNRSANACEYGDTVTIPGHRIVALVNRSLPTWKEGENPFTPDGKELVEPVRPKGKENWNALTRQY